MTLIAIHTPSTGLLDEILARSGGNPFYAEQLMAVAMTKGDGRGPLPQRLRDVLEARLSELPPNALEAVQAAAAAGRRVDDAMLAGVLGIPFRELMGALRVAVDHGILIAFDDPDRTSSGYAFRQPLLQEVAYGQLLPGERAHLHEAYAAHLIERRADDPEVTASELAFHLDGARQHREAVPVLIEAGGAAERAYAFGHAGRLYERALELWDRSGIPDVSAETDRVWVMQRAAECALLTGAPDRAIDLGREAIATLERGGAAEPVRLGILHERLRWFLWQSGDHAAAEVAVTAALVTMPTNPPSVARARVLAQAAGIRMEAGDLNAATRLASDAIALARSVDAPAMRKHFPGGILGWCQAVSGDVDVGTKTYREALAIAEKLRVALRVSRWVTQSSQHCSTVSGEPESSLAVALDGYALVRRLGVSRTYSSALLGHAAKALFDLGRWAEAAEIADQGLDLDPVGRAAIELHLARARIDANQGRFAEASAHLARSRLLCDTPGLLGAYGPSLLAGAGPGPAWRQARSSARGRGRGHRLCGPRPAIGSCAGMARGDGPQRGGRCGLDRPLPTGCPCGCRRDGANRGDHRDGETRIGCPRGGRRRAP